MKTAAYPARGLYPLAVRAVRPWNAGDLRPLRTNDVDQVRALRGGLRRARAWLELLYAQLEPAGLLTPGSLTLEVLGGVDSAYHAVAWPEHGHIGLDDEWLASRWTAAHEYLLLHELLHLGQFRTQSRRYTLVSEAATTTLAAAVMDRLLPADARATPSRVVLSYLEAALLPALHHFLRETRGPGGEHPFLTWAATLHFARVSGLDPLERFLKRRLAPSLQHDLRRARASWRRDPFVRHQCSRKVHFACGHSLIDALLIQWSSSCVAYGIEVPAELASLRRGLSVPPQAPGDVPFAALFRAATRSSKGIFNDG